MAVGFRGRGSGGSSGGIDFDSDYFNVPLIALNKIVPRTDYSPPPVTGDDDEDVKVDTMLTTPDMTNIDIPGVNAPVVPFTPVIPPIPGALPGGILKTELDGPGPAGDPGYDPNMQGTTATFLPGAENTEGTGYFQKDKLTDSDIDQYLTEAAEFAYNPATNQMEAYDYPLNTVAPSYADTQSKFVMGTEPGMSGEELKNIAQNAQDVQKTTLEIAQANPTADAFQIAEALHTAQTGFDSAGNFVGNADNPINNDPVTQAFSNVPDYGAGGDEGPGGSNYDGGSIFDDGGAASGGGKG